MRFKGKIYDDFDNIIIDNIDRAVVIDPCPYYKGNPYVDGHVRFDFSVSENEFKRTGIDKLLEEVDKKYRSTEA